MGERTRASAHAEGASENAIGAETLGRIEGAAAKLRELIRDRFEPYQGVYRLNDFAEYVSEEDWENVWAGHPAWWPKAWLLADNGQHTSAEVSRMSVAEIEAAFDDPTFEPEYAFYTEVDEEGLA